MERQIFLSGFPGFIGGRLVRCFLERTSACLHLLVHPSMKGVAEDFCRKWGGRGDRICLYFGDITRPWLGLSGVEWRELTSKVEEVFHLAALYNLSAPYDLSYRVNVLGTYHMLQFCRACRNLRRHNYFSTAYVAGRRRGRILETELDCGQSFRNHYERTKFEAEVLVQESMDLPTTIYRPAIVVGDSRTGEIGKYDGPYYAIYRLALLERRGWLFLAPYILPPVRGDEDSPLNVVPVDFIVEAVFALSGDRGAEGRVFHLVHPRPMSVGEFRRRVFSYFGVDSLPFSISPGVLRLFRAVPSGVWDRLVGIPQSTLDYLVDVPVYDTAGMEGFLLERGVVCPPAESLVGPMVEFVRRNLGDVHFVSTPMGLRAR